MDSNVLLEIRDLKIFFDTFRGTVQALDGVNITLYRGESLGLVGETGCGKSVTARSIIRLIDAPGYVAGGQILFDGTDLLTLTETEMRAIRGRRISFVFQEAKKALNPTATIGSQVIEALTLARGISADEARKLAPELLGRVGLSDTRRLLESYSFELSGGMAQRVMIALAVCGSPQLIIADEPTSALDVSVQAQILRLLDELISDYGSSLLVITHNLGVAAENCHRIVVMYAGRVAEVGPVDAIFHSPRHPYTERLLKALPTPESVTLASIPGTVPDLIAPDPGCRFYNRCHRASETCRLAPPPLVAMGPEHVVACHHPLQA